MSKLIYKFFLYLCILPFVIIYYSFNFAFKFLKFIVLEVCWIFEFIIDLVNKNKIKKTYYSMNYIDELSGIDFEYFVAFNLLPNMGFYDIERTQDSVDFGVDVLGVKDEKKYAIQCKRFAKPVGIKAVQEVIAGKVYYNCSKCMVVSNNTFTPSAVKLANKNDVILFGRHDIEKVELKNLIEDKE